MNQRNKIQFLGMWLLIVVALASCGREKITDEEASAPNKEYRRIISTSIAGDTLLIDVLPESELERIVGLSKIFNDYALNSSKQKIMRYSIPKHFTVESLEGLFLYQPDLVIMSDWAMNLERRALLLDVGINVFVIETATSMQAMYQQLYDLAVILGEGALSEVDNILMRTKELEQRILRRAEAFSREYPKPLSVLDFNVSGQTAGSNTTFDLIMNLLRLENLGKTIDTESRYGYAPLSEEMLFILDPDILIVDESMAIRLQNEAVFASLKAVQNNMVIELSGETEHIFYSPTYHIIFAALYLQEEIIDRIALL